MENERETIQRDKEMKNEQFNALKNAVVAEIISRTNPLNYYLQIDANNNWGEARKVCVDLQKEDTDRRVPRFDNQEQKQNNNAKSALEELAHQPAGNESKIQSGDYRVVPRGLLEHCLGVLEDYFINDKRVSNVDIDLAISQLKVNLMIEKSLLKAEN